MSKRQTSQSDTAFERPVIVYIHGIGDQEGKRELKRLWDLSLFGRDMGEQTRMAYWADILDNDLSKRKGVRAKAAGSRKPSLNVKDILRDAGVKRDQEQAAGFIQALAESVAQGEVHAPSRRGMGKKILPLPRFLRRPIAEKFLRHLVKDSAAYFFNPTIREEIKKRLKEELPKGKEPFILVSHSQGTVVSFEVLAERRGPMEAPLFLTMGSPLGIREVQDLIEERDLTLTVPKGVGRWHNFADRLDPVALDATLRSEYVPSDLIQDHMVINEGTKDLQRFNPHSSIGYLAHPKVRAVVHNAIGFDLNSRFIVARDVAERFVGGAERQPVLIETLHPGYGALNESAQDCEKREQKQKAEYPNLESLAGRNERLKAEVIKVVKSQEKLEDLNKAIETCKVQKLRKYVAAHLTRNEITALAEHHTTYNIYAVWRSSEKRKLLNRSAVPLKVDAARASYSAEGRGITWAVLDTGVRRDHPHFGEEGETVVELLDCTKNSDTPIPIPLSKSGSKDIHGDRDGHGTHVAGIIAGKGNDDQYRLIRGIAPETKLIVYKVLDDKGNGEDSWIIKAIDDIYQKNSTGAGQMIHGVNLSLGGAFDATVYGCGHSAICSELRDLWRQGVLVCVAAGNEGQIQVLTNDGDFDLNTQSSIGDPANLDECIAVGSVHADKPHLYGISYFSSRGPTADGRKKPDVVAPGERIKSANAGFKSRGDKREYYRDSSGTSMACPHVSGLLASFLSVRKEYIGHPDKVKKILIENCNDLNREPNHQGAGLPNLMKMLLNT